MSKGKDHLDWGKLGTVEAIGEWLRSKSDAICVLVIRAPDSVLLVDPACTPRDAGELVAERLGQLLQRVEAARKEGKKGIRLDHGPVME
ncbi:hypothetical protein [Occallatibacter riparius]|uniref:Uncharacterized protein n=1 Tax=Occallatibacter riparius TaxID=1002689 RepID=A0A9J7BPJ6_9BACT|nr:hypothetical protein [Occallatibacter riparius]UWZ84632.1 hypothetical protein MOP44_01555 [Occallatibacter riparius]